MVATLTRIFGTHNLELAEDVVQDTLLQACRQWAFTAIPENPSAWLFKVAKNKALDKIRREKYTREYASDISHLLKSEYTAASTLNEMFLENEIRDDQLRMMFACCHPAIAQEAQVALTLKTLCGFGVAEIAKAFLTNEENISKRLYRAKEKLRELKSEFEIPEGAMLDQRLGAVLSSVYLLFNEGYNSTQHDSLIREDLVEEALRLTFLLAEHPRTDRPEVHAFLALMLFHTARAKGRLDENGEIILLAQQDRSKWNREMIRLAMQHLDHSSQGQRMTVYHLEAGIASYHAMAPSYAETNWDGILELYNLLFQLNASPVIALNRAIIIAELKGAEAGVQAINEIAGKEELEKFYLFHATLGDLHARLGKNDAAKKAFANAIALTKSKKEIALLQKKISAMGEK